MDSFAEDSANPRAGLEVMVGRKTTVAVGNGEQALLYVTYSLCRPGKYHLNRSPSRGEFQRIRNIL